jgi:hypothetical protein
MIAHETLGLWEFPADADRALAAELARERADEPDARAVVVAERPGALTVQLVEGTILDAASLLFVERRGPHDLLRREVWPPSAPGGPPRELLVLRARTP